MKLKFKFEVWSSKFEVKSEVKIEVNINSWRKLKMKKFNIETDNIITGKKENFKSEKVCLDDVKVKTEEITILEWKTEYSGIVSSRISALNVIKVWAVRQSITDIGTESIN